MKPNSNSDVVKFLKAFVAVLIGLAIVDFAVGESLAYLYKKQVSGVLYKTNYAINKTKAEYIVVGSSRATHHYDPDVFEDSLKTSFYNCGRDGYALVYSCAVVSAILDRYTPKCIIFDILPNEFTYPEKGKLSALLPYYSNPAVRPYIIDNGNFERVKHLSKIYPYNSIAVDLVFGMTKNFRKDHKGYIGLENAKTGFEKVGGNGSNVFEEKSPADSSKIKTFFSMLDKLNKKHIRTLLIISPFGDQYINSTTTNVCNTACKKYSNATFLNFTNAKPWTDHRYFYNFNHLNAGGAKLFSGMVASYLIKQSAINPIAAATAR